MKILFALLPLLGLAACATQWNGKYIEPAGENTAVLVVDNRGVISEGRQVRILSLNSTGCVGYSYVTTDQFAVGGAKDRSTNRDVYQIRIPAGEKVVLNVEELIDQPHVETTWYLTRGFTPQKGYRYELATSYYLAGSGSDAGNAAPPALQRYVQETGRKEKANQYVAVLLQTAPDGKSSFTQWEDDKLPAEKNEGYCPSPDN